MSLTVVPLDAPPSRAALLRALARPGAAALEGWRDGAPWRVYLPWPEEVETLPWPRAGEWQPFVAGVERRRERFDAPHDEPLAIMPFVTGWVGFIAYEAGALSLDVVPRASDPVEPAAWFARHRSGIAVSPDGRAFLYGAAPDLDARRAELSTLALNGAAPPDPLHEMLVDSMGDGAFPRAVEAIRSMIGAGDVYQVNLTRAFSLTASTDPVALHLGMTGDVPPRCTAFVRGDSWAISSASPEVLLHFDRVSGIAESKPIKGTVRRADDDAAEIADLLASAKDDSEHLMIVDLVRNDLGTVAPAGRVSVPAYKSILTLPYVHHLESTVRATGLEGRSVAEILGAIFPGGSITGAPKRAAVHAIRDLEPVPRGVYTGAIGFLGDDGRAEFSVAIRTAVVGDGTTRYHAGGGIVWDSDPAAEDAESRAKTIPFLGAIGVRS